MFVRMKPSIVKNCHNLFTFWGGHGTEKGQLFVFFSTAITTRASSHCFLFDQTGILVKYIGR